ncbi:MAG: hypothetical protein VW576_02945 [Opitutae bacterium]
MNWLRKLFFSFVLLSCLSLHSNELNDLESRIDQMLERLQKVDSKSTTASQPPFEQEALPAVIVEDKLPEIILPSLPDEQSSINHNEVADSFNRLENRIDDLLNRLDLRAVSPAPDLSSGSKPVMPSALPVINLDEGEHDKEGSLALPIDTSLQDFEVPVLPKNRLSFYLGFSIPNDSTYSDAGNHDIEFENGFEIGLEYNRFFEDESYIGAFIEGKFFDTDTLAGSATTGDNRLINFGFTVGQDWTLSEHFAVKTQASIGASSAHYEITSENYSSTDLAFHYSFLLGLEVKWNEYWQSSLYYELDGRSSADRMDYQSFHQLGIETGIGF